MKFWMYMLKCSDESYYVGQTDNLEARMAQHHQGAIPTCYTFKRRPLILVFSQDFPTRIEALAAERQIKGWSRAKKAALVKGDWAEISTLARGSSFDKLILRQAHPSTSSSFDKLRTNGADSAE